jgi:two-component system KDP operon response regulator KdpE
MATSENKSTILVIEDEAQMQRLLRVVLENAGYAVLTASTGNDGIVKAASLTPNAVLLDLGLPDMDGLSVLKRVREWSQVPVLVLSVRSDEEDKVKALDGCANDYITKPFSSGELLARLRAALRLAQAPAKVEIFHCGTLTVDLIARTTKVKGNPVRLTFTEYALLVLFIRHVGKALTHEQILREVWGPAESDRTGSLRVHIARLREKLEPEPSDPRYFLTEPGVGYRLVAPETAAVA